MKLRGAFSLVVVALAGFVWACGAGVATGATETAAAGEWIDVPYVAQPKDGCGAAAIAMVMQYWAKEPRPRIDGQSGSTNMPAVRSNDSPAADPLTIQSLLFVPAEKGIPARAMIGYFQRSGYRAFAFRGEWSDLEHHISLGRPLIVSLKASGAHGPLHYAVVVGIDRQRGFVFLNDPARGKMLRFSREGFLGEWNPANNWTLLAVPAEDDSFSR